MVVPNRGLLALLFFIMAIIPVRSGQYSQAAQADPLHTQAENPAVGAPICQCFCCRKSSLTMLQTSLQTASTGVDPH